MIRSRFNSAGQAYDLSHLNDHVTEIELSALSVRVAVEYSCHVFTRSYDAKGEEFDLTYVERGERRTFCHTRHTDSLNLPVLVSKALSENLPAYLSRDKNTAINYFVLDDPRGDNPLRVFFDLTRSKQRVKTEALLIVRSAYRKGRLKPGTQKIRLNTIVTRAIYGQQKRPLGA